MNKRVLLYGNVQLNSSDIECLAPGQWIKDSIIEYQFERWETVIPDISNVGLIRPALLYLLKSVQADVGLDLDNKELLFFPVNDGMTEYTSGSHWSLLVFNRNSNEFFHYDSMDGYNELTAREIHRNLRSIFLDSTYKEQKTPKQLNGYDCGIIILLISKILLKRFTEWKSGVAESWNDRIEHMDMIYSDIKNFRNEILSDILEISLTHP